MAQIRYDIVSRSGGWCILCDGILGPPYYRKVEATRDARWIADLLRNAGDAVEVYLTEPGQTPSALI